MAYLEPSWLSRVVGNRMAVLLAGAPVLAVRGRTSGEWRTVPVNVLDHGGERYVLAPRGETQWVRNLRAAGGGELRRRKHIAPFTAVEVPVEERPELIAEYLRRYRRQPSVTKTFEELPDPADHPMFRILAG